MKTDTVTATPGGGVDDSKSLAIDLNNAPDGLAFELSEGKTGAPAADRSKIAKATMLSAAETAALLAQLPAIKSRASDTKSFAFRERSLPAPRTGKTVKGQFPPKVGKGGPPAAAGNKEPLRVIRFAPEGDVPVAPRLTVTFNQPMVAVTSHDDTVKDGVPVKLTPQPAGKWRWVGTKTLLFDPDVRFPAATNYKVEVPAGARSTNGKTLAKTTSFTFRTPAPRLIESAPAGSDLPLSPIGFVKFDQRINPAAVLDKMKVRAKGKTYKVRLATSAELEADKGITSRITRADKAGHQGRYIAFAMTEALPKDANVVVDIGVGTPSAEGPRVTRSRQSFTFRTYAPLRIVRTSCEARYPCTPGGGFTVRFNNKLKEDQTDKLSFAISPDLPRQEVTSSYNYLYVQGTTAPRTVYDFTVPSAITDVHGQTLGKDQKVRAHYGSPHPTLFGPSQMTILDPAADKPTFDIHTVGVNSVDVEIYQVEPKHIGKFIEHLRSSRRNRLPIPGKRVEKRVVKVAGPKDTMSETAIALDKAIGKHGHAIVYVRPTSWPNRWPPQLTTWVQRTDIGLDAFADSGEVIGWATDLATGKPLTGVELTLHPTGTVQRTAADGKTTFKLRGKTGSGIAHVVARRGNDSALMLHNSAWWSRTNQWKVNQPKDRLSWYVFDDRGMYKPKETVHVKGWVRSIDFGEGGDVQGLRGKLRSSSYRVMGPRGNEITKGKVTFNSAGGFDLKFKLPGTPNLGFASIQFTAAGSKRVEHYHRFQIQEFRRPDFEVKTIHGGGPFIVGDTLSLTAMAKYYAGGPLPAANVNWRVTSSPASFTPPNRKEFQFGSWVPWWISPRNSNRSSIKQFSGKTDAVGQHALDVTLKSAKPARAMNLIATATVQDVNRQALSSSSTILVHPSSVYVGVKRDRYFVRKGDPIEVDVIAVDHDGKAMVGQKINVTAARIEWKYKNGKYTENETDLSSCQVVATAKETRCKFPTTEGGRYQIVARVIDKVGRPNETKLSTWVAGGERPPQRNVAMEKVELIPSQKDFRPGDSAEILVMSPFYPATALISTRRSGIVTTQQVNMTGPTTTIKVPITEAHVPNVYVQVDIVGSAVRVDDDGTPQPKLERRPAYASGSINLPVPPVTRKIDVAVSPAADKVEPGSRTSISVRATDHRGAPIKGAELAVIVVDEAVLALSNYKTPDPLAAFYPQRGAGAADFHNRAYIRLAAADAVGVIGHGSGTGAGYGRGGGGRVQGGVLGGEEGDDSFADVDGVPDASPPAPPGEAKLRRSAETTATRGSTAGPQIAVRIDFSALATFAPKVRTNADGRATIQVKMPDSLTRYRVMVAAVSGERQFGSGEANVTARKSLMVRPTPPRFLNFGDTFEFPVMVQNQTSKQMTVKVAMRATNAALTGGAGRLVTVPANDRIEVRFPSAAQLPGTARFQVAAISGKRTDAAEVSLPVWTPATTEAFATYGEIDRGAIKQAVKLPGRVVKEFGGLEVTTSSTQLQALTDAFVYLTQYPYECSEQTASRILSIAALRDVLSAFKAKGLPEPAEIESYVDRDIKRLAGLQNWDGGFSFWRRGTRSWPYISIHVAHALVRAKNKGYKVPAHVMQRSANYLRQIERHFPATYGIQIRRTLTAYALYVRMLNGDVDAAKAKKLVRDTSGGKKLAMEAVGWVLGVLAKEGKSSREINTLHRLLDNRAVETASAAHWASGYSDGAHLILHSNRRADGIILESLIAAKPKSDLIPKVVRGLLAHRKRGRWGNTQENVFALLAMDRYFEVYEKVTPNFVAQVWLGNRFAGEEPFRGRQTKRYHLDIPMTYMTAKPQDLVINKKGAGRLYYRVGMTYAPASLELDPSDHGFAVERTYEAVDAPGDVERLADGTWKFKAGARVRVRLTMVAQARRYHVALVDKLPAGLEPENPELATTGDIPDDPTANKTTGRYWWWYRPWYEHQNMRDERVEAFASMLWEGVHEYTYVARATTPGRFVVPPAKAEEMYTPETFGRTGSDKVVVE